MKDLITLAKLKVLDLVESILIKAQFKLAGLLEKVLRKKQDLATESLKGDE